MKENEMGPNITLTAFDGLVIFGPFMAFAFIFMIGNYFAQKNS
jgi:hypothetical protein